MDKKTINLYKSSLIIKIVSVVLSFINTIIINRSIGIDARGEYAFIINTSNMCQLVLNCGIGYSYPYFVKKKVENIKQLFSKIVILQFIIYFIVATILLFFINDKSTIIIIILSIILTLNFQILFITMIEDIKIRNQVMLISSIAYTIILLITTLVFNGGLAGVILVTGIKYFIEAIVLMKVYNLFIWNFKNIYVNEVINILKIGTPTMIMTLLISINYNIDIIIMKFMANNYEVGVYSVAVTLANMIWIIPDSFKEVLFNRSAKTDSRSQIVIAIILNCILCIIITLGFVLLGKYFLSIVYGVEYLVSYKITIILFFGTIPMIFYKLIHPLYIADGNQVMVMKILLIAVISNVLLNIFIIPLYGGIGAAIASVVSYSICGCIFVYRFKKDYKINYFNTIKGICKRRREYGNT